MNSFYYNVGTRIRELRERRHYSREKFAEIVDISPKFLYEIETGQKGFSADTLYRIAKGFSVTCEYILSGQTADGEAGDVMESMHLFDTSQQKKVADLLRLVYELSL